MERQQRRVVDDRAVLRQVAHLRGDEERDEGEHVEVGVCGLDRLHHLRDRAAARVLIPDREGYTCRYNGEGNPSRRPGRTLVSNALARERPERRATTAAARRYACTRLSTFLFSISQYLIGTYWSGWVNSDHT